MQLYGPVQLSVCPIMTGSAFPPVPSDTLPPGALSTVTFLPTFCLWRYTYSLKWPGLSLLCSSLPSKPSPEGLQRPYFYQKSVEGNLGIFLSHASTFFQPIPIIQFQSHSISLDILSQEHPTLSIKIYISSLWLLKQMTKDWCLKTIEIYSLTVLEAKSPVSVSLGPNQVDRCANFLPLGLEGKTASLLCQLLQL